MDILKLTLGQMLELFLFMLMGFILKRKNILKDDTGLLLSRLETLVSLPALIIDNMSTRCTVENLTANAGTILFSISIR